ncbi:MAG: polysaccharide biosynthesis/export family protein [Acidobacteriaceae bacterium]
MIRIRLAHVSLRSSFSFRLLCVCSFALSFLLIGQGVALAQFSGPATSSTSTYNQTLTATTNPAILYPGERDVVLTVGDMVSIRLFSDPEYNSNVRINNDGTVLLPLIGIVHLEGLSVTQAEQLIAEKLVADGMYRDPQVTLQITEGPNAVVTIIGEIHTVVPVIGSRHLLDVLSTAGGLPPTASHVITINRPGVPKPIVIDLGTDPLRSSLGNIPVFPGDTIVVSRIGSIYIFGAFVGGNGTIPLNAYTPLTLTEATALSGGIKFEAKNNDLRIIRTVGDRRTVAVYNIKKVLDGKVPDPILEPNDIVYLPPQQFKQLISSGGLGTLLSVADFAILIAGR